MRHRSNRSDETIEIGKVTAGNDLVRATNSRAGSIEPLQLVFRCAQVTRQQRKQPFTMPIKNYL